MGLMFEPGRVTIMDRHVKHGVCEMVIDAMQEDRTGEWMWELSRERFSLQLGHQERLTEKLRVEQSLKEREGVNRAGMWGKNILNSWNRMRRGLMVGGGWLQKHEKETSVAGTGCKRKTVGETADLIGELYNEIPSSWQLTSATKEKCYNIWRLGGC